VTDVVLTLTPDEALVLFDVLHRWEDAQAVGGPIDNGERIALWNLSALLERALVEPFEVQYADRLAEAKRRLVESS